MMRPFHFTFNFLVYFLGLIVESSDPIYTKKQMRICYPHTLNYCILRWVFILCLLSPVFMNAQTWYWAKKIGGIPNEESRCVTNDPSGNVIITGAFRSASIPVGAFRVYNRTTNGSSDVLVVKYNSAGTVLWALGMGGTNNDVGRSVSCDASGNIYVTGYFRSAYFNFGTDSLSNTSGTFADAFVAKIAPNGIIQWVKVVGGSRNDYGNSIAADGSGNTYVSGYFNSDTLVINNDSLFNNGGGSMDMLTFKLDASGNKVWGRSMHGALDDQGQSICIGQGGDLFITGYYDSDTLFTGSGYVINPNVLFDDFIVYRADTAGNISWLRTYGSVDNDRAYGISSNSAGELYICGRYGSPTMAIDTITLTNTSNLLTADVFVSRLDPMNGNAIWAKSCGGTDNDLAEGVSTDASGNVYTIGRFNSPTFFTGNQVLNDYTIGTSDIFLTAFDSTGTATWSLSAGRSANDFGMSVSTFSNRIFITGYFRDTLINFGPYLLGNASPGNQEIFVAALGPPVVLPVELISFNAEKKKDFVLLKWTTATEWNCDYFSIEKSEDGVLFHEIGKLNGYGNSTSLSEYTFKDYETNEHTVYYRLIQHDYDGHQTYYGPVAVKYSASNTFRVLNVANPVYGKKLFITYESDEDGVMTAHILSLNGKIISNKRISRESGINQVTLETDQLDEGTYLVKFVESGQVFKFYLLKE